MLLILLFFVFVEQTGRVEIHNSYIWQLQQVAAEAVLTQRKDG